MSTKWQHPNPFAAANAVLVVLQQMAEYDPVEHESKLADLIIAHQGNVVLALLALMRDQGAGRDTCITVQALGDVRDEGQEGYEDEIPRNEEEAMWVNEAERFARELEAALRGILCRPKHGIAEAFDHPIDYLIESSDMLEIYKPHARRRIQEVLADYVP